MTPLCALGAPVEPLQLVEQFAQAFGLTSGGSGALAQTPTVPALTNRNRSRDATTPRIACTRGTAGNEGDDDVGSTAIEVLSPAVVEVVVLGSAWRAASWTSRSGTPASSAAMMKAPRNMCGWTIPSPAFLPTGQVST
jgi:hypothetical protein